MVEYRDIPSAPGYRAGSDGSIWSSRSRSTRGEWRKKKLSDGGHYLVTTISDGSGGQKTAAVHVLVLEAFRGPCPAGMQACHGNLGARVNRIDNLRWDTPSNNNADKVEQGTWQGGARNPNVKLTEESVRAIRALAASGVRAPELGRRFGVTPTMVHSIVKRRNWTHI